jgi:citrate synthase
LSSSVEEIIARELKIAPGSVHDGLEYGSIPEWDSLNHVNLMLALESAHGVEIDEDLMVELSSVAAIREFVQKNGADA